MKGLSDKIKRVWLMRLDSAMLVEKYQDKLFAAAFSVCKNPQDAEDAVQECFISYHSSTKEFESEEHIKAWLLRVVINRAKNCCRSLWRRINVPLDDYAETLQFECSEDKTLFETVMALPEKYRIVLHLYYYEDYPVREIAAILSLTESNVKVRLNRARAMLREILKEGWSEND